MAIKERGADEAAVTEKPEISQVEKRRRLEELLERKQLRDELCTFEEEELLFS